MREIEVKILAVDRKALERRLRRLGARRVFDGTLRASFFDFKDGRFRRTGKLNNR